eukprot:CAMPEP_0184490468 /NCGR_PEP_ID=MMETSP0113_2-20130426/17955_1 /TAXON_ID=91329 /ORGANISM="Norrisiella sphaerica, Strain BC52" /LENGTH=248 /DNA_ID=CAMNT_0026874363 /DNA_START=147 /DNA_END=890 /DNA_ORIENTATION=+
MQVLVIGPARAGKSVLLSRFQSTCREDAKHKRRLSWSLSPTKKKTNDTCHLNPGETCGIDYKVLEYRGTEFRIREVGYPMRECWSDFYESCDVLIYVIDATDRLQVAPASTWLTDAAKHEKLLSTPILIVFNKIDLPYKIPRDEFEELLMLRYIRRRRIYAQITRTKLQYTRKKRKPAVTKDPEADKIDKNKSKTSDCKDGVKHVNATSNDGKERASVGKGKAKKSNDLGNNQDRVAQNSNSGNEKGE